MQRWEYTEIELTYSGKAWVAEKRDHAKLPNVDKGVHWTAYANQLGAEGWELAGYVSTGAMICRALFKRPLE